MAIYNAIKSAVKLRIDGPCFNDLAPGNGQVPLRLVFSGIYMSRGGKAILQDISGRAEPRELLAIMGPSGSGKTSLLNALSGRERIDKGAITLNGQMLNKDLKRRIALSQQQDNFMSSLTLDYTLTFYAQMQLPSTMTDRQKMDYKNRVASLLKLDNRGLLKTRMGDVLQRGLSGGEMKRANIACEMFSMPGVLLVDEPTTGLDSHNALNVIQILKDYAVSNGTTVVVTVHQPSSLMFQKFDKLLVMGEGKVAYFGNRADAIDKFAKLGMKIEPHYNPGDFIVDQLYDPAKLEKLIAATQESRQQQLEDKPNGVTLKTIINGSNNGTRNVVQTNENVQELSEDSSQAFLVTDSYHSSTASQGDTEKWPLPFRTQMRHLIERNFYGFGRKYLTKLSFTNALILSFVVAALWFQTKRNEESISIIKGWTFFTSTIWLLQPVFETMTSFPAERAVINRERASGMYRLSAYYCSKMIAELPIVIIYPTIFHLISYSLFNGLQTPITFFGILGILLLSVLDAQSLGLFVGAICHDIAQATVACSLYCLPSILSGGFFVPALPYWLSWIRYTSSVYYVFHAMQIVEFAYGRPILCARKNSLYDACRTGNATYIPYGDIVELYIVDDPLASLGLDILFLIIHSIVFRLLGYLALKYYRSPTRTI